MKKSIFAIALAFILATNLSGCGKKTAKDVYAEIYKRYNHMTSYYAAATVTVFSDKEENRYAVRQFFEEPHKLAFFVDSPESVAGSGYVAQNGQFTLKSGTGNSFDTKIAFPDSKNCMFLNDFFEEYYKSEETAVDVSGGIAGDKIVLRCYTSDRNPNRFMQSLALDTKTYLPILLTTYNTEGKSLVEVEFHDFKRNADIDEKIFN